MRGDQPIKEFTVKYDGMDVNVCVVSGLANAHEALRRVKTGEANYHLIEVINCCLARAIYNVIKCSVVSKQYIYTLSYLNTFVKRRCTIQI